MEATRVDDSALPVAADATLSPRPVFLKSFALDSEAAGEDEKEKASHGVPSSSSDDESFEGDMLLQESQIDIAKGDGDLEDARVRVPIRAHVSAESEEVGDGDAASFGSAESFDSALERMAASSTASNDAFASPKGSPVGSYSAPGVWSRLEVAQRGALMRLNELNSGFSSLDVGVMSTSNSVEDFRARVGRIAERNGLSADDGAVRNILELLLPLVQTSSVSSNGNGKVAVEEEGFWAANESPLARPVAKLTAEDEPLNNSDEDLSLDEDVGESTRPKMYAVEDATGLDVQEREDQSDVENLQSAQGLPVVGAEDTELDEENLSSTVPVYLQSKTIAGGGKTDAKMEHKLDVKADNEESLGHAVLHSDVNEKEVELLEKAIEQQSPEQESDLQSTTKDEFESSVPEALELEGRVSRGEESEDQKIIEDNLSMEKHVDLEVLNKKEHHMESDHPVQAEAEYEERNQIPLEHLETEMKGMEVTNKVLAETSSMEVKEELKVEESPNLAVPTCCQAASLAPDSEARHANEDLKGGLGAGHEVPAALEVSGEYSSEISVALENEDRMQESEIVCDLNVSETVDLARENLGIGPVADMVSILSVPEASGMPSEMVYHGQAAKALVENLVPKPLKVEEDKIDAAENESAVSEFVDPKVKLMPNLLDMLLTENIVKELPDKLVEKDSKVDNQKETIHVGDLLEAANTQLTVDDSATVDCDALKHLKYDEKESLLMPVNPEDQHSSSLSEEKNDTEIAIVLQPKEGHQNGSNFSLVNRNEKSSESVKSAASTYAGNPSRVEFVEGPAIGAAFDEEDEDEEESYWNDDEIVDDDKEDDDEDSIERSAALAALVRAVDSSKGSSGNPSLGSAGPSLPARPAGLGRSMPSLEPAPRISHQSNDNGVAASQSSVSAAEHNQPNGETNDSNSETREKLQAIRVKFLRLAHRLGQSAQNVVVAQVLYRLGLAEQLRGGRSTSRSSAFSFDRASAIAEELEAAGQEELDFTCTIMLLGKTGVGKSATINSIFDEVKAPTNAFIFATQKVQEITGTVHGIKLRIIDTPGLLSSVADQRQNEKIMASVKRFIKKSSPDIVLYFDRLDMQSRDFGDLPLLRTITDTFGAAIWFNAIVVLTHASSAPPDGPNGVPVSYEMFVAQRSHVVQQTIRQAAGDTRLMNPVSLVENHPACRMNRAGERVLPNGQVWKPQLLLLSFASKILAEANSLLKLQENAPGKPFGTRSRVPPLPFLLSSLLQSRAQLKMPDEQVGEEDESDEDVEDDESDDEGDYDELPPFRRLRKEEIEELDKEQRRLYFEELKDREKLFLKKQWNEELKRRKELKKRMGGTQPADMPLPEEIYEEDGAKSAAVPVALPDMAMPPTFDSDNPSHRYRYLETASQWLVRPVLETHGWDHDSGYDGLNVEKAFIVSNKVPVSLSGQITKDKKEANITLESAASLRHEEGKVTLAGFDVQTMGKDLSYTLRSETRFSNFKRNKTIAGIAFTILGDTIAAGLKLEDRLTIGKRLKLVMNGGAITGRKDVAYGGTLEVTVRDKDYPISRTLSTLGLSVMDWHGDLAIGGNLQSQFVLGKTMMVARANLNNRGAGQISIRATSSEQLQMALIGLIPIVRTFFGSRLFSPSHSN